MESLFRTGVAHDYRTAWERMANYLVSVQAPRHGQGCPTETIQVLAAGSNAFNCATQNGFNIWRASLKELFY